MALLCHSLSDHNPADSAFPVFMEKKQAFEGKSITPPHCHCERNIPSLSLRAEHPLTVIASGTSPHCHCERNAVERGNLRDCFVVSLLAMTYLMSLQAEHPLTVIASGTKWSVAISEIASSFPSSQ